ncbi:hypothetical protein DINM_001935 [Dirofilaria immitis]|nr:hypothetical protein [Dirofilaria immitis]
MIFEGTLVPLTTTQQIVLQHLIATAATAITASESFQPTEKTMDTTLTDHEFRSISLPSNLAKNVDNYQYENDSNSSQKGISSSNSNFILQNNCSNQDTSAKDMKVLQTMMNKVITLIEIATLNLKTERELVENEKCEVCYIVFDDD